MEDTLKGLPDFTFDLDQNTLDAPIELPIEDVKTEVETPEKVQEEETFEIVEKPADYVEPESDDTPVVDNTHLKALYNYYKDENIISHEGEFDGSKEQWDKILKEQPFAIREKFEESIIEAMPPLLKTLVEYGLTEGENFNEEKLKSFLGSGTLAPVAITTEEQAKSYLTEKYSKLHDEETVSKLIEVFEDEGTLLAKAEVESAKEKQEQAKLQQQQIEQAKETKAQAQQRRIEFEQNLDKELKATTWKPEIQKDVYNEIYSQNLRTKTASIANNPKALIKLANYLRFYDPKTGDIDESTFAKSTFSEATKVVKDKIDRHFSKSAGFGGAGVQEIAKKNNDNTQYEFAN